MKNKGFTLIEMLIALGIFCVLIVAIMRVFTSGFSFQRRVLEAQAVQRDGTYLMEMLSREIRMASATYGSNIPISSGSTSLKFINHNNQLVTYCRATALNDGSGDAVCNSSGNSFAVNNKVMNSSDVKVSRLVFYPSKTDSTGNYSDSEPMITIYMALQSVKDPSVTISLQSTVSMRLYYLHL